MRDKFIDILMDKLEYPNEAKQALCEAASKIISEDEQQNKIEILVNDFMIQNAEITKILQQLDDISESIGISNYTLHILFFMKCAKMLLEKYKANHISEDIFWDSMADLKYKLMECHEVKGIWGTFVATWFPRFFYMTRFALGRFQFEKIEFPYECYQKGGVTVKKGDTVYNIHIPSSGPMPREVRIDSYTRAYHFFEKELNGQPIIIVCNSWLLYPAHKDFLPVKSNIREFMDDFDIIDSIESDTFPSAWRIFGKNYELPPDQLPTGTSLQKAYANRLISGEKTGYGFGILLFDGNKIL